MPILYRFDDEGSFIVGDTETCFAGSALGTSDLADEAHENPERVAREVNAHTQRGAGLREDDVWADTLKGNDARLMAYLEEGLADGCTKALSAADGMMTEPPEPLDDWARVGRIMLALMVSMDEDEAEPEAAGL